MMLPTPSAVIARAFPNGLPVVRDQVVSRTNLFRSSLDRDAGSGDPGLFGPTSATWRMMREPGQALVGLRGALLQSLSAPVPTATDSTGAFYDDFAGRVQRTGAYLQAQNLGSMDEVYRSARRVRAMHRVVKGTADDGTEFDAGDTHQQAWVSMTMTDSYLVMAEHFGSGRVSRRRADQFVAEQSTHAALLDPRVDLDAIFSDPAQRAALQEGALPLPQITEGELPTTRAELESKMRAWTDELVITDLTRKLIDATVQLSQVPSPQRNALRVFMLATLFTIPDEWHELLAPSQSRVEEFLAAQAVQVPMGLMHAFLGPSPALDDARARLTV